MPKKTSNDEKFVMNFFPKGNNNKQIVNVLEAIFRNLFRKE